MRPLPAPRWSRAGRGNCPRPVWVPGRAGKGRGVKRPGLTPTPKNLRTHKKHLPNGPQQVPARLLTRPPGHALTLPLIFHGAANRGYRPVNAVGTPEIHTHHLGRLASPPMGQAATGGRARPEHPLTAPPPGGPVPISRRHKGLLQPPRASRNCAISAFLAPAVPSRQEGPADFGELFRFAAPLRHSKAPPRAGAIRYG